MEENKNTKLSAKRIFSEALALCLAILFYFILDRAQGIGTALNSFYGIIKPIVIGFAMAYILKPVFNFLENFFTKLKKKDSKKAFKTKTISAILSVLFGLGIVLILLIMIIPQIYNSVVSLSNTVPGKLETLYEDFNKYLNDDPELLEFADNLYEESSEDIFNWLKNKLIPKLTGILGGVGSVFLSIKDIIMGVIISIYVLNAKDVICEKANNFLYSIFSKRWAGLIKKEVCYADKMFSGFLGGKLLDSAIIGVLCYIFCLISKMPNTLLISVIIGVTNIIPFFGPFIGAIPTALLILVESPVKCLIFVIFIVILQQVDGNVIGPAILGKGTGMSGFQVLLSITIFGGLLGFLGMIIGVPVYATLCHIIYQLIFLGLKAKGHEKTLPAQKIKDFIEKSELNANLPSDKDWSQL